MHHVILPQGTEHLTIYTHECFVWEEVWAVLRKDWVSSLHFWTVTATASQKLKPGGREIYENINPPEICRNLREGFDFYNPFFLPSQRQGGWRLNYKSIAHSFHKVGVRWGKREAERKKSLSSINQISEGVAWGVYERVECSLYFKDDGDEIIYLQSVFISRW